MGRGAGSARLPARAQPAPGLPSRQPGRGAQAAQPALRAPRGPARGSSWRRPGHHVRAARHRAARAFAARAGEGARRPEPDRRALRSRGRSGLRHRAHPRGAGAGRAAGCGRRVEGGGAEPAAGRSRPSARRHDREAHRPGRRALRRRTAREDRRQPGRHRGRELAAVRGDGAPGGRGSEHGRGRSSARQHARPRRGPAPAGRARTPPRGDRVRGAHLTMRYDARRFTTVCPDPYHSLNAARVRPRLGRPGPHRLDHLSPHVGRRERPPHGRARAQPRPRARRRPRVVPRRAPHAGGSAGRHPDRRHPRAARLRARRGATGRGAGQLSLGGHLERAAVGADAAALERDPDAARGEPGGRVDPRRDRDRAPHDPGDGARPRRRDGRRVATERGRPRLRPGGRLSRAARPEGLLCDHTDGDGPGGDAGGGRFHARGLCQRQSGRSALRPSPVPRAAAQVGARRAHGGQGRGHRRLRGGVDPLPPRLPERGAPARRGYRPAGRPVRKAGVPVAVLGSARDITVRRRLERRQEALVALSRELATEIDLDRLLPRIAEEARRLTGMDAALVLLLDGEDLIFRAAAGIEASLGAIEKLSAVQQLSAGVMRTRRPAVHANLTSNAQWRDTSLVQQFGYQAMLAIPITLKEDTLGVLTLLNRDARAFADEELQFLNAVATHAALAIDNARLFQQTQARLRETETLLTVSQAVSATLDPTETMRRVAREIARTLDADMVGAYLADIGRNVLRPIAGYHVPPDLYESFVEHPIPIVGHPGMEEAWRDCRPLTSDDVANDPRIDRATVDRFPHQSLLFVPMIVKGAPIGGFFAVWWRERRRFTRDEMRLVSGISDQAAVLMENARLYSEATRRRREAEELARLARMLTESLDAADVGKRIVESSLGLLGGAFSVLRLLQPDGSLKLIASQGEPEALATVPPVIAAGVGAVGRAAREGVPVWSADVLNDSSLTYSDDLRGFIGTRRVRGYLAVPLRVKREVSGVIGIGDFKTRVFSETEVTLLQTFADQAAIALENSRLYGDLRAALRAVEESQQRVVQGERLRALGEMAGGVAHDFNNVLAIVVSRAEVLLNETEDAELQRQLNVIVKVALDAAQTVKRIQEFTRMRRARPFQPVDLASIISEVVEVTRSRWKDDAQAKGLQYDVVAESRPTPIVAGDPAELREALTNIVFNALDAMPEGGRVTLSTAVDGDHVLCRVSDTGIGMAEDVRQRVFDPFFTTKGERGTGLGLSVVYGIVTRHNAELDVQSQLGQGTTFIIKFPPPGETVVEPVARPVGKSR